MFVVFVCASAPRPPKTAQKSILKARTESSKMKESRGKSTEVKSNLIITALVVELCV